MIVRKNMGRLKSLLMLLMVLGFFFGTYNLVCMMIEHKAGNDMGSFDGNGMEIINPKSKFHVAVTATDAAYSQWQCRIMYYWYTKSKDMPGSAMGKFTRILHSGRADQLMNEIPTFVVDPLPEGMDRVCTSLFLPSGLLTRNPALMIVPLSNVIIMVLNCGGGYAVDLFQNCSCDIVAKTSIPFCRGCNCSCGSQFKTMDVIIVNRVQFF